ncbi:glycoside hydrolase family 3 C-terminal domain-containing protein [Cupriavidus sp. ISTL7]|nr:glycoside hydrolase family 3 C-terminal domain-containing protein [Cupriavidus sp. ISTL7]
MGARIAVISLVGATLLAAHPAPAQAPSTDAQINAIVQSILNQMTQAEKLDYVSGTGAWDVKPLPRLGVPQIRATDGGLGVRLSDPQGVAYPAGPALASTFSVDRAKQMGVGLGLDTRNHGFQQVTGPGLNMYRTPFAGRAFEYLSGEDPFLGAVLGAAQVNAIQSQGVWADAKHYLANEQEVNRFNLMETISERALREIYMVPFESAVKNANVAVIMCGFNGLNGADPVCESEHAIQRVLKNEWGFKGIVETDYATLKHGQAAAVAGVDIERPSALHFTPAALSAMLANGSLTQAQLDDKVRRILGRVVAYGFIGSVPPATGESHPPFSERAALDVAREGIVLLKNGGQLLPLQRGSVRNIAVIGRLATDVPPTGFGSAYVRASRFISEIDGLRQIAGPGTNIVLLDALTLDPARSAWTTPNGQPGAQAQYFANATWSGAPVLSRVEPVINLDTSGNAPPGSAYTTRYGSDGSAPPSSVRWTTTIRPTITGPHVFKARADGAVRLYVNGQLIMDNGEGTPLPNNVIPPTVPLSARMHLQAGQTYTVQFDYSRRPGYIPVFGGFLGAQLSWASLQAPADLRNYDAVVVAAGNSAEYEGEGFDHPFTLPEFQDELIANLSRANPRTIAVLHGGTGLDMRNWIDQVGAVLHAWYPGSNGGQALAEILFGDVNPSGKLPITIERNIADNPTYPNYPQFSNDPNIRAMTYTEDIFVGYRGFERSNVAPLFPFGFGLSYTTFTYSSLSVSPGFAAGQGRIAVSFDITNSGQMAGAEAAQVYVSQRGSAVPRPVKELKGFTKVFLQPGQTQRVTVYLDQRSLSYFDPARNAWVSEAGAVDVLVGASSQDIRLRGQLFNILPSVVTPRASNPLPDPTLVQLGPVHP